MFASHFFVRWSFLVVALDRFFFIWETKKKALVAGRVKLMIVLYSDDFTGIRLGGLSIGRLTEAVVWTCLTAML